MIERALSVRCFEVMKKFPVLTICGPRQSGKTTLCRSLFPDLPYINLESTTERSFAVEDRRGFMEKIRNGAIIDEVQRVPNLLSDIQVRVDEARRNGMFVLSGSQQLNLLESITQSLAGRTVLLRLLPLTLGEIKNSGMGLGENFSPWVVDGLYPARVDQQIEAHLFYSGYEEAYVERDVRQIINLKNLTLFQNFLKLAAGRIGCLLNKESLGRDVGASPKTIEHWLSVLEASFIIYRLQPWFSNRGKRLVKSPKLYFFDTGLACHLLSIRNSSQLESHPLRGNLFENFCINEIHKTYFNAGEKPPTCFYRDSHDNEIDLVIEKGQDIKSIEIKSSKTFHKSLAATLQNFELARFKVREKTLILGNSDAPYTRSDIQVMGWPSLASFDAS